MKNRPAKDDRQEPQFGYNARRSEPYFDEPHPPSATRTKRVGRRERSLLPIFLVGAVIILFAGFLWISYVKGPKIVAAGQLPVITADTSPIKVKPDNPGGAEIPFQDTTVYDDLNQGKQKHPQQEVEHLLAPPEQPMPIPAPAITAPAPITDVTPPATEPAKPKEAQAAAQALLPPPATTPTDTTAPAPPENEAALAPPEPVAPTPPADAAKPASPAPVTKPKQATPSPTSVPHNSVIQLGSFKDEAAANSEWQRLKTRYSDQLSGLLPNVMQVDLGEKGTWYRLRAGPLTADKAKAACAFLTNAKAPCIVSSR